MRLFGEADLPAVLDAIVEQNYVETHGPGTTKADPEGTVQFDQAYIFHDTMEGPFMQSVPHDFIAIVEKVGPDPFDSVSIFVCIFLRGLLIGLEHFEGREQVASNGHFIGQNASLQGSVDEARLKGSLAVLNADAAPLYLFIKVHKSIIHINRS